MRPNNFHSGGRFILLLTVLMIGTAISAAAQTRIWGPNTSRLFAPLVATEFSGEAAPQLAYGSTSGHAKEGALIGGLIGGITLTVVGASHCESDCSVGKGVLGFVLGAALGAIPGALIGGAIATGP